MRISLRQLEIFVAIAKRGSTTAAGEDIALSQSAISASLAELERALNQQLFDRVGKRLLLNDHGRAMLSQAMSLVNGAESLEQTFLDEKAPSMLVTGASLTIGNYLLPRLLRHFWQQQGYTLGDSVPPLQVLIANTADIINKVANFEVDIGLVEGPCHRNDIAVTQWLEDELLLVAAPTHPIVLEYGPNLVPAKRLEKANWLLRESGSGTREALERALLPHVTQLKSSLEFNDHEAIKQSAIEGLGIACLSKLVVEDALGVGKLVKLNTQFGVLSRQFRILTHRQKQLTSGMQRFISHAAANI